MKTIESYALGQWVSGSENYRPLHDAVSGKQIGQVSTHGLPFSDMIQYAHDKGNTALRKMTFQERGRMLKALAMHLHGKKNEFYPISYQTGATKVDSWIDIEGGIGNLFAYASLRKQFPDLPYYVDGEMAPLSKGGSFIGHHISVPKRGVAVHINAYNFPIWGMLEKIAVNLLAGVPAIVKPATVGCQLTEAMVRVIIASGILPDGALQLICGSVGDLLDHLGHQDVVTFTGSAYTGKKLKAHPSILENAVPFTMEADSLNASVLGPDVTPDMPEFALFVKEVAKEMTIKSGQKCTAIRRILVPEHLIGAVSEALSKRLEKTVIGNPNNTDVRMGSLAGKEQREDVLANATILAGEQEIVYGSLDAVPTVRDASATEGAFMQPILFLNKDPRTNTKVHEIEAFGPISTLLPFSTLQDAVDLTHMGKGSLVSSIVTASPEIAREYTIEAASHNGRILVLNEAAAKESTGHGSPMPLLTHGGPGRAGGGEEMGGKRGVMHYLQRSAIQGHPTMVSEITQVFQPGSAYKEDGIHPFRKHFEELQIGDTVFTHKHTVTETDITNFANVSGDNFYAHMDATSLEGTIFEERVAHGYFILSKAAGLFVEPKKGPVLLNYGLEDCRFTKPVYPGTTIGVKFTVKEKILQEKRSEEDIRKGIVKFFVDVVDEQDETVAVATILTMVKCLNQEEQ